MPCTFVSNHAIELFDKLTGIFSYKLKLSETGITDWLIYRFVEYCDINGLKNVKIYHAKKESVYGADIDLFVEQSSGKYIWFALQAKVMNYLGVYKDLRIKKKGTQQWQKLEDHEIKHGCKAFYLFYNGDYPTSGISSSPVNTDCSFVPVLKEYGLGIVARTFIEGHFLSGKKRAVFTDFFPSDMYTLKRLVCCDYPQPSGSTSYDLVDIDVAAPYRLVLRLPEVDKPVLNSDIPGRDTGYYAPYRIIISKWLEK